MGEISGLYPLSVTNNNEFNKWETNDFIQFQGQPFEKFPIMAPLNTCDVLRSISDDKSLSLFNIIALAAVRFQLAD
ncbi:hypothetical protein [Nitrososphaera sp. AFS]|uniref:hypothetical protein n=1 Tax=Nitrososphaera sp. AFS TaxID=2301191 RepID=UPI0013921F9A|nr:hypothetical protein [Nitrososphaera sp. AFS]NAL77535.1 hypothetical protein [Nitrososphaera sp. AFS]